MMLNRCTAFTLLALALCAGALARADEDGAKGVVTAREASAALSDGEFNTAETLFTQALASGDLEPRMEVIVLLRRATARHALKLYDRALTDLADAAKKDQDFGMRADNSGRKVAVMVTYNRGIVHESMGKYAEAMKDYDEALRRDPEFSWVYVNRGNVNRAQGRCGPALADYADALKFGPDDNIAIANKAWVLATCPDRAFRNGSDALSLARKVNADSQHPYLQNILAAALAEAGFFPAAVEAQEKALAMLGPADGEMRSVFQARLKSYEQGKPWRDVPEKTAK